MEERLRDERKKQLEKINFKFILDNKNKAFMFAIASRESRGDRVEIECRMS